jgi:hypothetical protein
VVSLKDFFFVTRLNATAGVRHRNLNAAVFAA